MSSTNAGGKGKWVAPKRPDAFCLTIHLGQLAGGRCLRFEYNLPLYLQNVCVQDSQPETDHHLPRIESISIQKELAFFLTASICVWFGAVAAALADA